MPLPASSSWIIAIPHGPDYYTLFYVLGFGVNVALLLWEGRQRGYPLRSWLMLLGCVAVPFILGTKLLALSGAEWDVVLRSGQLPTSGARSVLGGALASGLILPLLRRIFGYSRHVYDAFALPLCAALMVQCVGCILTGCCFGVPTSGSWGLTYEPDTLPYLVQVYQGLIPASAAHSLPTHPTQLYALVLCAAVSGVLLLTHQLQWPGGSRRWLQVGLLLLGRFVLEFWREPAGEPVGAATHAHGGVALLQLQWALLPLTLLALGIWWWQVRQARQAVPTPEQAPLNFPGRNLLSVVGLLGLTAWLGPWALTLPEVLVIKALLLAVLGLEGGAYIASLASALQPVRAALPLGLASATFVLTSQISPDSARLSTTPEKYYTLSGSFNSGSFMREQNSTGCGGATPLELYRHRYTTGTIDFSRTRMPGVYPDGEVHKAERTIGIRLHGGIDQETPLSSNGYNRRTPLIALNPYVQIDRPLLGIGGGILLGSLGYHKYTYGDQASILDLQASVRIGQREKVYGLVDYNYLGYGAANPQQRVGVGTGLGGSTWQLRAGAASAKLYDVPAGVSRWSGFVEAGVRPTPAWQINSFVLFGNPDQRQVGLRLSRRFSAK
ncbi:prolipoprotein diacylglyceryl transferase [Hymenobacter sp. HSC-4F20]|uniref:prolipoprotein diacylglyceryl transferase family protein n=1 Tax=Hymenobacter sp. HSC-4F20 TaxID=2864135 RepID=UPI001C729F3F|nr:prolipoprotein diacylglyceryl transferase family protein [Hymenobacter sp. HSC-4F20]MBX0290385.1 prolipoprotein diacylglyceryl transferase [Hymenobacter sp. HSC-4F20]